MMLPMLDFLYTSIEGLQFRSLDEGNGACAPKGISFSNVRIVKRSVKILIIPNCFCKNLML